MPARRFTSTTGLLIALVTLAPAMGSADLIGVASVIDGDTIVIHGEHIRLDGIDTPDSRQLCELDGKSWRCSMPTGNWCRPSVGREW